MLEFAERLPDVRAVARGLLASGSRGSRAHWAATGLEGSEPGSAEGGHGPRQHTGGCPQQLHRAPQVGGRLEIDSAPEVGTTVRLEAILPSGSSGAS
jgi:hypothetical protein